MHQSIFKYIFYALTAVVAFFAVKTSEGPDQPSDDVLIVGMQAGYPPFDFRDEAGHIVGFDVDIAQHISDKLGKKLVIRDMEFDGLILSLKQGKIDLIMSGMNITPSRLKEIAMVPYHGQASTALSLIFWNEVPNGIHTIEDLAKIPDATVSVQLACVPEYYLRHHPTIQVKAFQDALQPLMDVKYGKSMANLVEQDVAEYLQSKHPEIVTISVPLPEDEQIFGYGIGVKKQNQELVEGVHQAIQEMKASGELQQLEDKWFKEGGDV